MTLPKPPSYRQLIKWIGDELQRVPDGVDSVTLCLGEAAYRVLHERHRADVIMFERPGAKFCGDGMHKIAVLLESWIAPPWFRNLTW